jgi:tetratricopeptide (TPR) repeat protein
MAAESDELSDAWQAYQAGDVDRAEQICRRLIAAEERHTGALFLLGLVEHHRGRTGAAIEVLRRLVRLRPNYAEAHNNLGNALAAEGRIKEAERALREATRLKPTYVEAHNNLGNVLREQRRLDEAVASYKQSLELKPDYADAHNNLGIAMARLGRSDEAVACYRRATELRPAFAEPHNNCGAALARLGRLGEAEAEFRRAIELKPDYADARMNLGTSLLDQGKLEEAAAAYGVAVERLPQWASVRNTLGVVLSRLGRTEEAAGCFRDAVALRDDYSEAYVNLGDAERELGELENAVAHLRRAIEINPSSAEAHHALGRALVEQLEVAASLAAYDAALRTKSDYAEAHFNRARAWLMAGDFRQGWVEYEWRSKTSAGRRRARRLPRWDGGPLVGQTVLIESDDGNRDLFQFARYARLLRVRGGRVVLHCTRALERIMSGAACIDGVSFDDEQSHSFDVYTDLVSLPRLFGTTLDTIPADEPYLFADEELVASWREKLGAIDRLRIGVAWKAGHDDHEGRSRSIPFEQFAQLAKVEGVTLVNLQKGVPREQLALQIGHDKMLDLGDGLDEAEGAFMDTAAVMMNVDLVISADTAVAHLAGALGVPVWVALPWYADWRWLLDRDDSPWYPTMWLYRQTARGNWDDVFQRLANDLREVTAVPRADRRPATYPRAAHAWNSRGVAHAERGKLDGAIALFRRALCADPSLAEAHNNLGSALRAQGRVSEAVECFETALQFGPDFAEAHHNLGTALSNQRRLPQAIAGFRRAVELKPRYQEAWNSLGIALAESRQFADAEACFRKVVEIAPNFSRGFNNLGNSLADQGRRDEAVGFFERALELDPNYPDAFNNLGNCLRELQRFDESVSAFQSALRLRPEFAEAHNNLGITLANQGKHGPAVESYRRALAIDPNYVAAHNNLGIALGGLGRYGDAVDSYNRALAIKSDYAEAHNNLGIALSQRGDYDKALACYRRAVELKPDYAEAYSNMGITLSECGRLDEALTSYDEALRRKPDYPDAYMNRALSFLVRGDFERGWEEYEWRWKCKDFNPREFGKPRWEGEALEGRTVLLHSEQGLGDTFQFVRYARLVKQRGGVVVVWCPRPLVPILGECPYIDAVTIEGEPIPLIDVHLPLLSLPRVFCTTLSNVPSDVPYLYAKCELVERWRKELRYIDAVKVGINWQGNPRYRGDRHRSIPLRNFAPLAAVPGVRLISLQRGFGTEQIAALEGAFSVTELGAHVDTKEGPFMDTAAVLVNLDLVVSSDTSLVHLAGGLGVPLWMPLPFASDWRWLQNRADSPWYPTMRLFRQTEPGKWDEVFLRIADAAAELVRNRNENRHLALNPTGLERERYEARRTDQLDQDTWLNAARLEGRAEGEMAGLARTVHFCQRFLDLPETATTELAALSFEELNRLAARLEQQVLMQRGESR